MYPARMRPIPLGSLVAGLAVVAGAFGAHALRARLDPAMLQVFETAARYQLFHGLALIAAGLVAERRPARILGVAAACFGIGTLLFSGSLYALALTGVRAFGAITPLGGLGLIAGWICLAAGSWETGRAAPTR